MTPTFEDGASLVGRAVLAITLAALGLSGCGGGNPSPVAPASYTISGYVYDGSYPFGARIGISGATITYGATTVRSDSSGRFELPNVNSGDPLVTINASGFHEYKEQPSRMVNGGYHLIPEDVYRGFYLVVWASSANNTRPTLRKWDSQTEFVVVRAGASDEQVNALVAILHSDEYRKMTGGRFTSSGSITIVDAMPNPVDGKTVMAFGHGIVPGGIAHSDDRSGIIFHGEITWDTSQRIDKVIVWHEMVHTVTTGGHINEWPSVVSEVSATGFVTDMDEKILNCIYNSPPLRGN